MAGNSKGNQKKKPTPDRAAHEPSASGHETSGKSSRDLIIVGIGASAGGLDALQKVLPGLPAQEDMAYVIAQHLAPKYRSMLGSLLSKHTTLPIEIVQDGMVLRPDTIYITPPNKDVSLAKGRLKLSDASPIGPKPSIDYFFTSLAEEKGPQAVGIILSGTGTDGAHGIRAIKSNDGITIAQNVASAKFNGMPNAAIQTGCVDLILSPERIGPELESALKYPQLVAKEPARDSHLDKIGDILSLLGDHTGADFSGYKTSTMFRRISRRMVLHKLHSLAEYLQYAGEHPEELDTLYKDLLISVTSFFRDAQAFEALSKALRDRLETKQPGDAIRMWVPACSSGEEAYSIAILLAEILGRDVDKYRIQIFATDIDEESVQRARKGVYPFATVMDTDVRRFERYFTHADNRVTIKKELRDMVVLAKQNLLKDTPFLHLDLISCRNLLIYLENDLQERLLSLFHFSLDPDGLLFLGKSESINKKLELFSAVEPRWKIYKRKETLINRMPLLINKHPGGPIPMLPAKFPKQEKNELWKERQFASSLLNLLDCSAILTDEQGNIVYIRGDVSAYLRLPEGSVKENLNAVNMARPEIRFILQSLLHRAKKENGTVTGQEAKLEEDGQTQTIRIQAGPVGGPVEPHFLVAFVRVADRKGLNGSSQPHAAEAVDESRLAELEHELAATRGYLQDTVEELETSSEELQSLNEELQSANEELQASNEELETSNEELQASNEELNTVNEELRVKSDELAHALNELEDSEKRYRLLVDHMSEALMLCELEYGSEQQPTDLIIRQANNAFERLLEIELNDLPLRARQANMPELVTGRFLEQLVRIVKTGKPQRLELHLKKLDKDLNLAAYHLDAGRIGVICHDETQRRKSDAALRESESRYRELVQHANSAIIRWKADGTITFFNEYARQFFGYQPDEVVGKHVGILIPECDSSGGDMSGLVRDIVASPERFYNYVNENVCSDGRRVWMTWTNKPILDENGKTAEILAVGADITERKRMQEELARYNQQLEGLVKERTAELEKTVSALRQEATERRAAEAQLKRLSKVFMDATDPIIIEDLEHNVTDMNHAAEKTYGFSRNELIGRPVTTLVPKHRRAKAVELRRRCVDEEAVHEWEGMRQDHAGHTHPALITAFLLRGGEGQAEAIVTITKDISAIKNLQKEIQQRAGQLARLTSELTLAEQRERHRLAKTLHDHLQQLLAGVKLKLEMLAAENVLSGNPELAAAQELLLESLHTSRSLATELSPPVLFQQGLSSALKWLARHMKKTHYLKVEVHADKGAEPEQEEIKILLFESVRELLFNVVKHAGKNGARVDLTSDAQWVNISVSDKGAGFDPVLLEKKSKDTGGFGLFNIRERLQLLGGSFEIESGEGNGTTVRLTSPLRSNAYARSEIKPTEAGKKSLAAPAVLPQKSPGNGKIRVMLADDHAVMRDGLSAMLARHDDVDVVGEASDGEEAVAMARHLHPDVVLMDINMPNMDGIEATRIIRAELKQVSIIGLSMYEAEDQAELIKKAGAVAYINKAGSSEELLGAIREAADGNASR